LWHSPAALHQPKHLTFAEITINCNATKSRTLLKELLFFVNMQSLPSRKTETTAKQKPFHTFSAGNFNNKWKHNKQTVTSTRSSAQTGLIYLCFYFNDDNSPLSRGIKLT